MIKIEYAKVMNLEGAIRGARNPMNSWERIDSRYNENGDYILGENDLSLAIRLCRAGSDHRKFIRQILVSVDITAPLYWWKEFDTYKVGTVANSCSTMHKLTSKRLTLDDFSIDNNEQGYYVDILYDLNALIDNYKITKQIKYFRMLVGMLPSSYNQKRTAMFNYEVLANIYKSRQGHKLKEWHDFCEWIEELPYSELIKEGIHKCKCQA